MPFKFLIPIVACSLFVLACGKEPAAKNQPPQNPADNPRVASESDVQSLKVYQQGETPQLNKIQATNLKLGKYTFDFGFEPVKNEGLSLDMRSVGPGLLLGCDYVDVAPQFILYQVAKDGSLDLTQARGLGPSPILVDAGSRYRVRVNLALAKDCLGVTYQFGVIVTPE